MVKDLREKAAEEVSNADPAGVLAEKRNPSPDPSPLAQGGEKNTDEEFTPRNVIISTEVYIIVSDRLQD